MIDELAGIIVSEVNNREEGMELMDKLVSVAQPSAVYGAPVASGDYTVITASEVSALVGFGYGVGGGTSPATVEGEENSSEEAEERGVLAHGIGGGCGGGGVSTGRPVAIVSIGPDGVWVDPVVDRTKIALAFFTTIGSMLFMLGKMRRASRG